MKPENAVITTNGIAQALSRVLYLIILLPAILTAIISFAAGMFMMRSYMPDKPVPPTFLLAPDSRPISEKSNPWKLDDADHEPNKEEEIQRLIKKDPL